MVLVKITKNKAYFKRFQVKYRRRREGKTDYRARRTMIQQDKTKYGTPKYRLVVRITNRDIVCQIVHAKIVGDDVIAAAYSHELPAHGIPLGLTNYAAAYATGLLCARRALTRLGIDQKFLGVESGEATGAFEAARVRSSTTKGGEETGQFPFKAILDVGIARTTTGARIFGAMKGAVDGGIAIPHKPNRFPGFDKAAGKLDANVHRERIFGLHVANHLKQVKADDKPRQEFGAFVRAGIEPDSIEDMYKKAHASIRQDPSKTVSQKKSTQKSGKRFSTPPLTLEERKAAAAERVQALRETLKK
jgi:large subunit ribosomal protein L5e